MKKSVFSLCFLFPFVVSDCCFHDYIHLFNSSLSLTVMPDVDIFSANAETFEQFVLVDLHILTLIASYNMFMFL